MRQRIEKRLMLMLAVQFYQLRRQFAQRSRGRDDAINEGAAAALTREFPFHNGVGPGVFEDRLDGSAGLTSPHKVGRCTTTQQESDGFHEDRFTRSRLTGQDVEARFELDVDSLDYREVTNAQDTKHVSGTSIVSYV